MSKFIVVGIYLLLRIQENLALQCYQCNFCGDPFKVEEANIVNCTGSCEKALAGRNVVRLCALEYLEDKCKKLNTQRKSRYGCACNSDLCNGGEVPMGPTPSVLTVYMVFLFQIF